MPVIAEYKFSDCGTTAQDSASASGVQNGTYLNGAASSGGQAVLDGHNDYVKINPSDAFQMESGTLNLTFTSASGCPSEPETILSRDSCSVTPGGFHIDLLPNGAVQVVHETGTTTSTLTTPSGFCDPCDTVTLSYSWDADGAGRLVVTNTSSGAVSSQPVPPGLTMDMDGINQPWIVGAGQAHSPAGSAPQIDDAFQGKVDYLSFSNTVDNCPRDGIVSGTGGSDEIDLHYVDDDGDRIDAHDAILSGDKPEDDVVKAGAGNDTVRAGEGADEVYGGDGNDYITTDTGTQAPDRDYPGLYTADADRFDDRDTVDGGSGNDTIQTGDDADLVHGGSGHDSIDGGVDDDTLFGDSGADTLIGGEGSDSIDGGSGNDIIYGGLDPSWPDALNLPDASDARPDNGRDTLRGGDGNDSVFGADDADLIYGDAGRDRLDGGIDQDTIYGGTGSDTIIGGDGADLLKGGADRDLFVGGGAGDVIDGNEEGDDRDTLDLSHTGQSFTIHYDANNHENGEVIFVDADGNETGTLTFRNIEEVVPCFTPGTLIATPKGEVPVEWLKAGDKIITRDNGIQEIRWVSAKPVDWAMLTAHPHLKPILIQQGSLGNGLPERDMMVSPNHRMLVANDRTALYFDEHEVLVSAKHLATGRGVQEVDSSGTTYIHFMFDRHQVVLSNGAWSESFQPGDYTLRGVGNAQRNELFELFPELRTEEGLAAYTSARRTLRRHEARLLVR